MVSSLGRASMLLRYKNLPNTKSRAGPTLKGRFCFCILFMKKGKTNLNIKSEKSSSFFFFYFTTFLEGWCLRCRKELTTQTPAFKEKADFVLYNQQIRQLEGLCGNLSVLLTLQWRIWLKYSIGFLTSPPIPEGSMRFHLREVVCKRLGKRDFSFLLEQFCRAGVLRTLNREGRNFPLET